MATYALLRAATVACQDRAPSIHGLHRHNAEVLVHGGVEHCVSSNGSVRVQEGGWLTAY
jgi:hypothetical protein